MALRDQPYLPLYVQDFLTDERLNECSAESTGVYIRLMCLMHKSQEYGVILLKQKDKQSGEAAKDFAAKLARQMPYQADVIERSLRELLEEEVVTLDGDRLYQRRMVKDGKLSTVRQEARSKRRSDKTLSAREDFVEQFVTGFVPTKHGTNSEIETEIETDTESVGVIENEVGINTPPAPAPAPVREDQEQFNDTRKYLRAISLLYEKRAFGGAKEGELKRLCAQLSMSEIAGAIKDGQDWEHIRDNLRRLAEQKEEKET